MWVTIKDKAPEDQVGLVFQGLLLCPGLESNLLNKMFS